MKKDRKLIDLIDLAHFYCLEMRYILGCNTDITMKIRSDFELETKFHISLIFLDQQSSYVDFFSLKRML